MSEDFSAEREADLMARILLDGATPSIQRVILSFAERLQPLEGMSQEERAFLVVTLAGVVLAREPQEQRGDMALAIIKLALDYADFTTREECVH